MSFAMHSDKLNELIDISGVQDLWPTRSLIFLELLVFQIFFYPLISSSISVDELISGQDL